MVTRLINRSSSALATCPAHLSRWAIIMLVIKGMLVISLNSLLCLLLHCPNSASQTGPHILLRIPFSNTSSFRSRSLVSLHVSQPYVSMGLMMVLYAFNFVLLDKMLLLRTLLIDQLHLAADAILSFTSSSTLFSVVTVEPRYLKLSTASNSMFPHLMFPSILSCLVTFIILVFCWFISRPTCFAKSWKRSRLSSISRRFSPQKSMSSAYASLSHTASLRWIPFLSGVRLITHSNTRLKRSVESAHPFFKPLLTLKGSVTSAPIFTLPLIFL